MVHSLITEITKENNCRKIQMKAYLGWLFSDKVVVFDFTEKWLRYGYFPSNSLRKLSELYNWQTLSSGGVLWKSYSDKIHKSHKKTCNKDFYIDVSGQNVTRKGSIAWAFEKNSRKFSQ